ncbi:MAG: amylo-alpha-1,6-glucosidase [Planctomycetota bacterium]
MKFTNLLDVWGGGQLLAFSGVDGRTDYDSGLVLRTRFEGTGMDVKLPGRCELIFNDGAPAKVLLAGDFFNLTHAGGRTRGAFVDAHHLLIEGPCQVGDCDDQAVRTSKRGPLTLVGSAAGFDEAHLDADLDKVTIARQQFLASFELPRGLSPLRRRTLAKALSQMKTQVCTREGQIKRRWTTPDRWPHRSMWLWDSAFHAIGWRLVDAGVARDAIQAVLDGEKEDGFLPHMHGPDGSSEITQPPVLTLATVLVDQIHRDEKWLKRAYPKLAGYVDWDLANRDVDGAGLVEWLTRDDPNSRCDESGMDNCSRFAAGERMDAVDFNSFVALECELLSVLAAELGKEIQADQWARRHAELCRLINERLWDERRGLYVDCVAETGEKAGILSGAGFLPLLCGAASEAQADRLGDHVYDENTFGTPLPIPTVAACETEHYDKDMWRGPVWINLNWLVARGFDRYGMGDVADHIREKTTDEIERRYEEYGTFFEFYDDRREVPPPQLKRKGKLAPEQSPFHQVFFDYGWSATLYVDMVIEQD